MNNRKGGDNLFGYLMAVAAFLIAMLRPVDDVQFVALMIFAAVGMQVGSKFMLTSLFRPSNKRDERTN